MSNKRYEVHIPRVFISYSWTNEEHELWVTKLAERLVQDGAHYALVWEVSPVFDAIMVIPTTSKAREEYPGVFSVRSISGLPAGDTTLLISDMTRVSRKRISPVYFNHPKKGIIKARLAQSWTQRILEGIAVVYGNEITFERFIGEQCKYYMPSDLKLLRSHRFKPVKGYIDEVNKTINYRLWNSDDYQQITYREPNITFSIKDKKNLIKDLFSDDPHILAHAEKTYETVFRNVEI